VRHLAAEPLKEAQAAGVRVGWSNPPQCDTACTSHTLSCTL
jgi:hypothetical protein